MKSFILFLILLMSVPLVAQEPTNSELFIAMKNQSSLLYERGFNQCDMKYLESITHLQFSAYYELGEAQSREKFFEDVRKFHCENVAEKHIRKVDPSSLEVFSLEKNGVIYGAVQSGSIGIYQQKSGTPDFKTGTSKFTHIWLLESGKWFLKEAMSFGHQGYKE